MRGRHWGIVLLTCAGWSLVGGQIAPAADPKPLPPRHSAHAACADNSAGNNVRKHWLGTKTL